MRYFPISKEALVHLSMVDKALADVISTYPQPRRVLYSSAFECIVSCIVQQQISSKVAENVFCKLTELLHTITAENVLSTSLDSICSCGLSQRKAQCIFSVAEAVVRGELDFITLSSLPDNEIEKQLLRFKGIGSWTVEMLLIFGLSRPNVFSTKDFGIKRGFYKLHPNADINVYKKLYSPYATVASLYLWEIL